LAKEDPSFDRIGDYIYISYYSNTRSKEITILK